FPSYIQRERSKAGLPPTIEGIEGGDVEAIEGTLITVHARTNEPAASAKLVLSYKDAAGEKKAPSMDIDEKNREELNGKFRIERDGTYTIKFRTTGDQENPRPVEYDIKAIPDRAPTAQFLRPEPTIRVPSNGKVALRVKATDDHGVKEATLNVVQGREILQ